MSDKDLLEHNVYFTTVLRDVLGNVSSYWFTISHLGALSCHKIIYKQDRFNVLSNILISILYILISLLYNG